MLIVTFRCLILLYHYIANNFANLDIWLAAIFWFLGVLQPLVSNITIFVVCFSSPSVLVFELYCFSNMNICGMVRHVTILV